MPDDSQPMINPFLEGPAAYRVKRYRERAQALRTIAEDVTMHEWRGILLRLANSYDEMASTAETGP